MQFNNSILQIMLLQVVLSNVSNTNATTVNFAGAGTTVSIGATATGTTTVNNDLDVTGNLQIGGLSELGAAEVHLSQTQVQLQ